MQNLYLRGISGLVYVLLFTFSILYSEESYLFITYFFGLVCIREFMHLTSFKNIIPYLLFTVITYFILFKRDFIQGELLFLIITLSGSVQLIIQLFFQQKKKYPNTLFQKFDISLRYLIFSLAFLLYLPFYNNSYNPYTVLSLVILIWSNDSFAFLIGKNFGKHKLLSNVSPKKTIEGFIGGIVFTLFTSYIISLYLDHFSLFHWLIIGLIASVLGTIGDLVESKFKRQAKAKDSGHIMPGHGGLLDRLDSLLFVAPFVYLYIHYII